MVRSSGSVHLALFLSAISVGCSSGHIEASSPGVSDDIVEASVDNPRVHPVVSAGVGLFVILEPSRTSVQGPSSRREYIGYDAELVILPRPAAAPSSRFTLVSEDRRCIARSNGPVTLWIEDRRTSDRLTQPVDAVALDGCGELEHGEWLVAIDGAHESARWQRPEYEASFTGSAEVTQAMSAIQHLGTPQVFEAQAHLARFDLGETALSALALSQQPISEQLGDSPSPCEVGEKTVTVSLVRENQVVATFEAGERLGVLTVGEERSYVVYLGAAGSVLRAWQIGEHGLELVTEAELPVYSEQSEC